MLRELRAVKSNASLKGEGGEDRREKVNFLSVNIFLRKDLEHKGRVHLGGVSERTDVELHLT